ncbi:MAG TPA: hypothetical protein VNG89_26335, partial [Vicinamibacterales bacterium]|nr:hypothetical protein [Vicinamibacterales bacterium]
MGVKFDSLWRLVSRELTGSSVQFSVSATRHRELQRCLFQLLACADALNVSGGNDRSIAARCA